MYFLPALFIIMEFLFATLFPGLAEISAHQNFIKKNPNVKVIDNPSNMGLFSIFAIFYVLYAIGVMAYVINLLFTPLWIIGTIILAFYFFQTIIKKMFPKLDSDLSCFLDVNSIDDEKLKRKFKLLELKGSSNKRKLKILIPIYLSVLFRISLYVSIIVLHYNYGLDPHMLLIHFHKF